MDSEQRIVCKYPIDTTYWENWDAITTSNIIGFIKTLGLEYDINYTHHYVIVDEKKWFFSKIKYGL